MKNSPKPKLIDISRELTEAPVYPGDPVPELTRLKSLEKGDDYNLSLLSTGLHAGTHIDAPSHFLIDGENIDEVPLDNFIGACKVVKATGYLTGAWIDELYLYKCEKLLIKGAGKGQLDTSAAEELVASGVKLVGIDTNTIGMPGHEDEVHRILLEGGCAILEGLNLEEVEPDEYFLFAFPIKIAGAEAAPCRAVLAKDYLIWNK